MAWEVYVLDDVQQWMLGLDKRAFNRIQDAIEQLEEGGPGLGRPTVDTIKGSRHPNGGTRRPCPWPTAGSTTGWWSWPKKEATMDDKPRWVRWEDVKAKRPTTPERRAEARRANEAEVAAWRLAEIRRQQHQTQAQIAAIMGVGQRRVSDIESSELLRTEVSTIDSYVEALGGRLRLIAEFGDNVIPLR